LVEQRIENPRVAGSIPALGTINHSLLRNDTSGGMPFTVRSSAIK
jgi:hypothetical protein